MYICTLIIRQDVFIWTAKAGLKSENTGIKYSAMHNLIKYNEYLNISNRTSAIYVMREFMTNDSEPYRRLALIALYNMNNDWAMDSLKRQYKFEENPSPTTTRIIHHYSKYKTTQCASNQEKGR